MKKPAEGKPLLLTLKHVRRGECRLASWKAKGAGKTRMKMGKLLLGLVNIPQVLAIFFSNAIRCFCYVSVFSEASFVCMRVEVKAQLVLGRPFT